MKKLLLILFTISLLFSACQSTRDASMKRRRVKSNCNCPGWGMIINHPQIDVRVYASL